MKETLRKKSKSSGSETKSEFDAKSQSTESTSVNPWVAEAASPVSGESNTRRSSKVPESPDTGSIRTERTRSSTIEHSPSRKPGSEQLTVPGEDGEEGSKPTRRRKTITKSPHTFELVADLKSTKPAEPAHAPTSGPNAGDDVRTEVVTPKKKKKSVSHAQPVDLSATSSVASTPVSQKNPEPAVTLSPPSSDVPESTSYVKPPRPTSPAPPAIIIPEPSTPPKASSNGPVNPFVSPRPKRTLSTSSPIDISNPCRFTPAALPGESFHGKVVVLTNGASQVGQSLIRQLHAAGARIIFGDTNADQARKVISAAGPPHVIHFNKCDMTKYADMVDLFKLAVTMYGRVDHAIFGIGDDGGQASTVAAGEKGWFEDRSGFSKTAKMAYMEVDREPDNSLGDLLAAPARFARIALAYLKYSPRAKAKKSTFINPYAKQPTSSSSSSAAAAAADTPAAEHHDRSLTFVTSVSSFKETPLLPIYQVSQHAVLGVLRTLRASIDPDPERDGVRVNAVVSNVMVPRALAQSGGRMSVQLPPDRPEDVARVVAGVIAANAGPGAEGEANGGGIWYEKGFERGIREKYLHGRVLYAVGTDCWDIQEGLDRSEAAWIGARPAESIAHGLGGLNAGSKTGDGESTWILDLS